MNDNIFEKIVDKIFSGSFSMLVLIGSTYCLIMLSCVYLAAKGKIPINEFLILVGGLATTFMACWKDYLAGKTTTTGGNGNGAKNGTNGSNPTNGSTAESGNGQSK